MLRVDFAVINEYESDSDYGLSATLGLSTIPLDIVHASAVYVNVSIMAASLLMYVGPCIPDAPLAVGTRLLSCIRASDWILWNMNTRAMHTMPVKHAKDHVDT